MHDNPVYVSSMPMRGLCVAISALCGILSMTVSAQRHWTVDDCIIYAIEHNYNIRNKRIDTKLAGADLVSAYGDFFPSVSIEAKSGRRFGHSVDPATNQYTSDSFWDNSVGLNVSLPIFEGLARINRVKFARLNKAMSIYAEKAAENSLALEIAEAFYRYSFDVSMYELAVEQRRLGELYYDKMTEYVRLGLRPRSDISELKARLQADMYQERVKDHNCRLSMSALMELMGMDDTDTLCVNAEYVPDSLFIADVKLADLYESARDYMPEYQIMRMRDKASHTAVSLAAGALYPVVRMEFNLSSGCYTARDRSGTVASFGTQLRNNLNRYVGISIAVPLFDGLRRYNGIRQEKMRHRQVVNDNERQRQTIENDIYDTYLSARTAAEEWRLADEQLKAASVVWHQNEDKWHEGLISGFELMDSRNRYMQAHAELVCARLHYMLRSKIIHFYRTGSFIWHEWSSEGNRHKLSQKDNGHTD